VSAKPEAPSLERRRLLKGATAAAPVIMTLAGKPVLGGQCAVSGMLSGPKSGEIPIKCAGCTPGYWKTHPAAMNALGYFPGTSEDGTVDPYTGECKKNQSSSSGGGTCKRYYNDGYSFRDLLGFSALDLGLNPDPKLMTDGIEPSLMQVLWLEKSMTHANGAYGAHLVAGALNALAFPEQYGYTLEQFKNLIMYPPPDVTDIKELIVSLNERGCPL
jgi:hypothetical protein